tara:strand:- start:568 stop:2118 length:1551 start_codon:yes stop_codon:yes gene_type:complete
MANKESWPHKEAVIFANKSLTYEQLVEQVRSYSGGFQELGIVKGTHVGFLLQNSIEFIIAILAIADCGAVAIPMDPSVGPKTLLNSANETDMDFLLANDSVIERILKSEHKEGFKVKFNKNNCISVGRVIDGFVSLEGVIAKAPDSFVLDKGKIKTDSSYILTMTSGSTSSPKPIIFSQQNKIMRALNARQVYGLSSTDVILVATPLYHSISQRLIFTPLITGGTCVVMSVFSPKLWINEIEKRGVTFTISVASQLEALIPAIKNSENKLLSLRSVVSCCAILKNEAKKLLIELLNCDFHECYGASEVGVISNIGPEDWANKITTVGRNVPGVKIRIRDKNGKKLPVGKEGEITCKSTMVFKGYYNRKQDTETSFDGEYFRTADNGFLDSEGYLVFTGRVKELIITGGANVYPKDIEETLGRHPGINEIAVIGIPDKVFGEAVLAVVIPNSEVVPNKRELNNFCLDNLAEVQRPLDYIFVKDFPRSPLGKILKQELKNQYSELDLTDGLRRLLARD